MQIANCTCRLDSFGSNVHLMNITPAEAMLLQKMHTGNANGSAVRDLEVVGNVERSTVAERARLAEKYGAARTPEGASLVDDCFPGASPTMPNTFKDAGLVVKVDKTTPAPTAPKTAPTTSKA